MNVPEGFKQTEVGVIPKDWETHPCSELSERIMVGIVIRPSQYYVPQGVPAFRSANIREEGINNTDLVFISEVSNALLAKSQTRRGDVLTVRTGYPGTSAVVRPAHEGCNCIDILITRPSKRIYSDFLAIWINSPLGKEQVLRNQGGMAQKHFNVGDMKNLIVAVPPITEQTAIAAALGDMDALIEGVEKLLEKKRRIKQGAMQELLMPKEGWEETKLGAISHLYQPETISEAKFTDEGYLVYGANGIIGRYPRYNHENWQTIITCRGSTCGTVNKTMDKVWITGNAMVVNIQNNPRIDKLFLFHLLKHQDFRSCITGSGQPQIVRSPLFDYILHFPKTLQEQAAIAAILSDMDSEIEQLETQLTKYRQLKTGMMQELLTGKKRLV